jgi:V8-like Glu-specific endopeptidase
MQLTPRQLNEFSVILQDAFDLFRFDEMLLYRLGIKRENIALGGNFAQIVFGVLAEYQRRHTTTNLVLASREANPDNPDLISFAHQFGLAPRPLVRRGNVLVPVENSRELEREIKKTNHSVNVAKWRARMGQVESQVCRIEIDDGGVMSYGTGFLVGPDAVLTNYHVVEDLIKKKVEPEKVLLRFDYKKSEDGTTINSGTVYHLESGEDWLIDSSEPSPVDDLVDPQGQLPQEEQLDYALLRVQDAPGKGKIGGEGGAPSSSPRRWVDMRHKPYDFIADTPLYIMQHPAGEPLKLAIDTDAVIGANENGTRVRYRTNTERGSSGSPCFNSEWELVALHHSGDPNYSKYYKPQYNEGIPTSAIFDLLSRHGKDAELGQ